MNFHLIQVLRGEIKRCIFIMCLGHREKGGVYRKTGQAVTYQTLTERTGFEQGHKM